MLAVPCPGSWDAELVVYCLRCFQMQVNKTAAQTGSVDQRTQQLTQQGAHCRPAGNTGLCAPLGSALLCTCLHFPVGCSGCRQHMQTRPLHVKSPPPSMCLLVFQPEDAPWISRASTVSTPIPPAGAPWERARATGACPPGGQATGQ